MALVYDPRCDIGEEANFKEVLGISFFRHLRQYVVGKHFTYLASIDGRHRSGKSLTACMIAYLIDPTFWDNMESRIVHSPAEFMAAVERIKRDNIKGAVIIVDEAGVSMSSSDWYEKMLKTVTKVVQFFGYLYVIVFFVAPTKDFVDSRLRKMFHAYYKVDRPSNFYNTVKIYSLKYNSMLNKWFYKHPIVEVGGERITVQQFRFPCPPSWMIERYENMAVLHKDSMLREMTQSINTVEQKEFSKDDVPKAIDFVVENYTIFEAERGGKDIVHLDQLRIEFHFHVPARIARYIKQEGERRLRESGAIPTKKPRFPKAKAFIRDQKLYPVLAIHLSPFLALQCGEGHKQCKRFSKRISPFNEGFFLRIWGVRNYAVEYGRFILEKI